MLSADQLIAAGYGQRSAAEVAASLDVSIATVTRAARTHGLTGRARGRPRTGPPREVQQRSVAPGADELRSWGCGVLRTVEVARARSLRESTLRGWMARAGVAPPQARTPATRSSIVSVRLSAGELAALARAAEREGVTLSALVRLVLQGRVSPIL